MSKIPKQVKQDLFMSFLFKRVVAIFAKTKLANKCKLISIFLVLQSMRN